MQKRNRAVEKIGWGGVLTVLGLFAFVSAGRTATPITFHHGQTHARANGYLHGIHSTAHFYFEARAGQHVKVKITGQGPTRGIVTSPGGQQDGSPGGVVFDDAVTQTGHYRLRVTEDTMAEAWHGRVRVDVWRH